MSSLNSYRKRISSTRITLTFLILYIISQISIMVITSGLGSDFLGLQITISSDTFLGIAKTWQSKGLTGMYYRHFFFDYVHPLLYGIFISSFMAKAFNKRNISASLNPLLLLPFIASALDLIENSIHLYLLADLSRVTYGIVLFSGICTNLKWMIALMSLFGSAALFFAPVNKKSQTAS